MKNSPLILGGAWLVLCLAVVLLGLALTLSPLELALLPPPLPGGLLTPLTGAVWALAVALLWIGGGHARGLGLQAPFAQLILFYPLLLAFEWLVLPRDGWNALALGLTALFLGAAVWLWKLSPPPNSRARLQRRNWPWDLILIMLPALLGWALGVRPDLRAAGLSTLLYPLYALLQLGVFLVLPARRLQQLGLPTTANAALCALVFALVHAPNPLVMATTAVAMFVWCRQYLTGRPLWRLAVVMGLAATVFSQFLADDLTGHMRVGPGYSRERAISHLAGPPPVADEMLPAFLERIYPDLLERRPTADEITTWEQSLTRARLTGLAWQFFHSDEYLKRAREKGWPLPPGLARHWTRYEPEWRDRIAAFGQQAYLAKCGDGWTDFLKCLYRDILRRQPGQAELDSWTRELTSNERRTITRLILDQRLEWRRQPFAGVSVEELRLRR